MYLVQKDLREYREKQLESQDYICPLCDNKIDPDNAALDHDHESGHIREVLCMTCNSYEGMVLHKFKRAGIRNRCDIKTYLKNLIIYWDKDYSNSLKHPTEKTKVPKIGKREFNKLAKLYAAKYPKRKPIEYPKSKKWNKQLIELKEMKQIEENK